MNATHTARSQRKGFTLVELLVVIGIIALLISMLLPSLNKARAAANSVACMSNMRSLTQAVFIYQAENRGSMAPLSQSHTSNFGTNNGYRGYNIWGLLRLKGGARIAQCPTVVADVQGPGIAVADQSTRIQYTYKYNWFISGSEQNAATYPDVPHPSPVSGAPAGTVTPNPYKKVANATEVIMFLDYPQVAVAQINDAAGSDRGMWAASIKAFLPATYPDGKRNQQIRGIAPIHGQVRPSGALYPTFTPSGLPTLQGDVNVAYCDGSVRTAKIKQGEFDSSQAINPWSDTSNVTTNGVIKVGAIGRIEGSRVLPYAAP